jgi:hypothetical protein
VPASAPVVTVPASAPVVTVQPTWYSTPPGHQATFSASATGTPTPTVHWEVSTNGGNTWATVAGATSDSYDFAAGAAENGYQFRALFSNASGTASTEPATLTVAPLSASNWSGQVAFADDGAVFSSVSGSWTVPHVTCAGTNASYSSAWIGIDGAGSSTVEQDGTEQDCLGGSPTYHAWYEMYGDASVNEGYEVELDPSSYPVSPADAMTASVSYSDGTWTLAIADETKGWSYSTPISDSSAAQASAEWIMERPEICGSSCALSSLANFGSVSFSGATASTGGAARAAGAFGAEAMDMTGSTVLDGAEAFDPSGEQFGVDWYAAS